MPQRLTTTAAKLGAFTAALVLGIAGLALAGVNLPDPAQQAFERAGISLPNQAGGDAERGGEAARSDEVKAVIDETPPEERGCEFGHRVAEAASGSAPPEHACEHGQDEAKRNGAAGAGEHSSRGREFGEETAEQRRELGEQTADEAQQLGADHPTGPPADVTRSAPEQPLDAPPVDTPPAPDHPTGPPADTPGGRP